METRARRAVCERASAVPREVWQLIVSYLAPLEAISAALVCSDFAAISTQAAQLACKRLWPHHAERVVHTSVQRFLRLVQAHEDEASSHPDVAKARTLQKVVLPEHRQIAVEWLIEVSWDWQLESTVVYRGTQYLDHYLSAHAVPALSKFQMLAISCLRTALKHSSKLAERERQRLPCKHWAEVTDGACTEAEVRSTCSKLERMLQQQQRSHPNAKQRLRYLWYRLHDAGVVKQEQVYVYMLASFLLHLSLLDTNLSATTPTKLAAAALSLSLKVFGFHAMPPELEQHCFYDAKELQHVQQQLARAQEEVAGQQLRALWVQSYSYVGTDPSQRPAYGLLQQIVSACCKLTYLPGSQEQQLTTSAAPAVETAAVAATAAVATATAGAAHSAAPPPAGSSAEDAAVPLGAGPAANRILTRAAAAAGLANSHRHQHHAAAAAAAAVVVPDGCHLERASLGRGLANSGSTGSMALAQAAPLHATDRAELATPQGLAVVFTAGLPAAPGREQLATATGVEGTLMSEGSGVMTPAAAAAAAAAAAGGAAEFNSSARRCPTRELPPRRAVAVSRYGMLASRGSSGGAGGSMPAGAGHLRDLSTCSTSSRTVAGPDGNAAAAAGAPPLWGTPGGMQAMPLGTAPATHALDVMHAAAEGASVANCHAAAAVAAVGSMTPASPKHTAAGTRGLAALFTGAGGAGSSNDLASTGSNTSRLLSAVPSLQSKLYHADTTGMQHKLGAGNDALQPSWTWAAHPAAAACGFDGHRDSGEAGPSSSSAMSRLHIASVPVLRSRRATAAAAFSKQGHAFGGSDQMHKALDRPGVHTRSSSGGAAGGSGDTSVSMQLHPTA